MTETALSIQVPTPQSETHALISMIERAARDPSIDIDKMARLIEMKDRMQLREAEIAFDDAMTEVQSEAQIVVKDSANPQTRSRYASYNAMDKVLRPIYTKHGLSLSFNTGSGKSESSVLVLCRVAKRGFGRDYQIEMPADGKGARGNDVMTKTHATGSAVSYGMRYLLKLIFNVAIGEDDDDNNAARRPPVAKPNVIKTPPHNLRTGEILDDPIEELTSPRAEQRAANSAAPLDQPSGDGGAADESDDLLVWDTHLVSASNSGMATLSKAWDEVPPSYRKSLKAALDRRYKPRAEDVDAARGSA